MSSNLLFFTGAGFSAGFLKYQNKCLTTPIITDLFRDKKYFEEIFDKLYPVKPDDHDQYKHWISEMKNTLLSVQKLGYKILFDLEQSDNLKPVLSSDVNFEMIFYLIEELLNFLPSDDENAFSTKHNKQIHRYYLPSVIADILPKYSTFKEINSSSVFQFKKFVLDFTMLFHSEINFLKPLNKYFEHLLSKRKLKYYTLNYDDLFLKALRLDQEEHDFESKFIKTFNAGYIIENNHTSNGKRTIDPNIIIQNPMNIPHCYFHIHGSVLYSNPSDFFSFRFHINPNEARKERRGIGNSLSQPLISGGNYDNNYIITGFDKDLKLNKEPHSSILKSFFLDSYNSNEVIICGYSFLDEHVNSTLKYVTNFTKSIQVIDFKSSVIEQRKFIANALVSLFEGNKKRDVNNFCNDELQNFFSDNLNPKIEFELCNIQFEFHFNGFKEFVNNELEKI